MPTHTVRNIANKSVEFVKQFFANLPKEENAILPSFLRTAGTWINSFDNYSIGVFYLTNEELQRAVANMNKGFPAFPGFFVSEQNRPAKIPVAIKVGGSCNYFASNHTSNIIAFSVCQGSSFTVIDHFHELRDSSGQEFKYRVDLAFFLGILPNEQWENFESRLSALVQHSLDIWKSKR